MTFTVMTTERQLKAAVTEQVKEIKVSEGNAVEGGVVLVALEGE